MSTNMTLSKKRYYTYIFGFVVPNLVSVAIFVENRTFFNFGGVGCGRGRC